METRSKPTTFEQSGNTLTGWASVFESPYKVSERGRTFTEVVKPGAFRRSLDGSQDVISLFNHDPNRLLGRTSSGTLTLAEDERGLRFSLTLPEHAADVREMLSRGDLTGASFQFCVRSGGESWTGSVRTLTDLHLAEVGPVVMPASPATSVSLRSVRRLKLDLMARYFDTYNTGGK